MIFTTQPVPRNQTPSRQFQNYGIKNAAPTPLANARIYSFPKSALEAHYSNNWSYLPNLIGAYCRTDDLPYTPGYTDSSFQKAMEDADFMFHIPQAVTSINGPSEDKIDSAKELGFERSSQGRRTIFSGPPHINSMVAMAKLGGEMYTNAPQERVSFGGALAAISLRRLLYIAFQVMPLLAINDPVNGDTIFPAGPRPSGVVQNRPVSSVEDQEIGHFLAYFPGLTLPDKSFAHNIIKLFNHNLGKTEKTRRETVLTITRGWQSLYNTSVGRIIAHQVFCLDLARQGGFIAKPFYTNGEYVGTFLSGASSIMCGSEVILPANATDIRKDIASMTSHTGALEAICTILSACTLRSGDDPVTVEAADITTARSLHYACKTRTVPEDGVKGIVEELPKLRFKQTFWKPLDPDYLVTALVSLTQKTELDVNAPFDITPNSLFATKLIYSTLAAYGPTAPSLTNPSPSANVVLTMNKDIVEGTKKQGTLGGLPIFVKPIQQAVEDWKQMKKIGSISFRVKGKTNFGMMKIADIGMVVDTTKPIGSQALKLATSYVKSAARKRPVEVEADAWGGVGTSEAVRDQKKSRVTKEATEAAGAFAAFGFAASGDIDMDD